MFLLGIGPKFWNGSTRSGLFGKRSGADPAEGFAGAVAGALPSAASPRRIGSAMFFRFCGPMSSKRLDLAGDLTLPSSELQTPPGFRDAFQPRGDVDAIAKDIVVVDDDVADVNADAEFDSGVLRHIGILPGHAALELDRRARRIHRAGDSTSLPSPVVLTIRPRCVAMVGSTASFATT